MHEAGLHHHAVGGGAEGVLYSFPRTVLEPGTTRLRHSVFGHISKETEESLTSGWTFLFGECLKTYVEQGKAPAGSAG